MAKVSMELIKKLRDKTLVGMMDCKKALEEAEGDFDRAVELLRKKGAAVAAKRAEQETAQGRVESNVAADYKSGSLALIACETDFSANTDAMKSFSSTVAEQVTASGETDAEKLLSQALLSNNALTLKDSLDDLISKICESIKINQTAHFKVENGMVNSYIHPGSTIGVMIQLDTPSDASAHLDALKELSKDICMHIAVMNPLCVKSDELDPTLVEKERALAREQLEASGKPANMIDKILEGKIKKYYSEVCLVNQAFIKNDKQTIAQYVEEVSKKIGMPITVTKFARFAINR